MNFYRLKLSHDADGDVLVNVYRTKPVPKHKTTKGDAVVPAVVAFSLGVANNRIFYFKLPKGIRVETTTHHIISKLNLVLDELSNLIKQEG